MKGSTYALLVVAAMLGIIVTTFGCYPTLIPRNCSNLNFTDRIWCLNGVEFKMPEH